MRKILLVIALPVFVSSANSIAACDTSDGGHPGSGYQGFFERDKSTAFCRHVGNWGTGSTFVRCSITNNKTGNCENVDSPALADPGYPRSARFEDVNGDGFIDFCRRVGDGAGFTRCNLGPDFGKEKDMK
jgi:hypothetical protein